MTENPPIKRKRGAQPGNLNAAKHGLYSHSLRRLENGLFERCTGRGRVQARGARLDLPETRTRQVSVGSSTISGSLMEPCSSWKDATPCSWWTGGRNRSALVGKESTPSTPISPYLPTTIRCRCSWRLNEPCKYLRNFDPSAFYPGDRCLGAGGHIQAKHCKTHRMGVRRHLRPHAGRRCLCCYQEGEVTFGHFAYLAKYGNAIVFSSIINLTPYKTLND
jgi:hypothetical protein